MRDHIRHSRPRWAALLLTILFVVAVAPRLEASEPHEATVEIASHQGWYDEGGVRWDSTYRGWTDADGRATVVFARPLPASTTLERGGRTDLELSRDASGRATGITGEVDALTFTWRVELSVPESSWAPPLAAAPAPQVVRIDGLSVDPDAISESPFQQRLGYLRHHKITDDAKDRLEALLPRRSDRTTIYLVADDAYLGHGGLEAILVPESERATRSWILLLVVAFVIVVASALGFALLRHQARHEEVEHFLSQHEGMP